MKVSKFEKLFQEKYNKRHEFREFADYIANHHSNDEDKEGLSSDIAVGLIMGEAITKNKHLLIGGAIGVGATALTIGIISGIKKLRKTKDKENKVKVSLGEVNEILEKQLEIEKIRLVKNDSRGT